MQMPTDADFVAWLERQPSDGTYDYSNIAGCLNYQFLSEAGLPVKMCGASDWVDRFDKSHSIPRVWDRSAVGWHGDGEQTYGAALRRYRIISEERTREPEPARTREPEPA